MELYTLNINVNKQRLSFGENKPEIFSGDQSIDFVEFTFTDDTWNFPNIWAIFSRQKGAAYQIALDDNKVMIPAEVMQKRGYVYIGLMATDGENVQTSSVLQYSIRQGAANVDTITPSPNIYEQFLNDLEAYQEAIQNLSNLSAVAETLAPGSSATASYLDGVLTLGIPQGEPGATGATGNGIQSIAKTGTSGSVDTYTITYTNGQTTTFTVTNGSVTSVDGMTGDVDLPIEDVIEHTPVNLMNFNDPDYTTGKYINPSNGALYNDSNYNTSGFIPVEEGETYTFTYETGFPGRTMRFICAFDSNKAVVGSAGAQNVSSYTVPTGVSYVRFSAVNTYFNQSHDYTVMFYKGTSIYHFYPYFAPFTTYKVNNSSLDGTYIKNEITENGMAFSVFANSLSNTDTLVVCDNIDNSKNDEIEFIGYFNSFTSLTLGHGDHVNYGNYAVIDNTYLTVFYGASASQIAQVEHGLTITDFIHVIVKKGNRSRASIQIMTASGDYTLGDCSWNGSKGEVFAKVGSTMTNCKASAAFKDFLESIFILGDSYCTPSDPARIPYYLTENGYTKYMLNAWGGRQADRAFISFTNILNVAIPKYAVWLIGMNDGDNSGHINYTWSDYTSRFIEECEKNNIEPILATIPCTPTVDNTYKNTFVRNSGCRYVDWAKAVNGETAGATWYSGMLSGDNAHPTVLGAKTLYRRLISDVPELLR